MIATMEFPPLGVGCAIWANPAWVGTHLPPGTPTRALLAAYAERFNAVEGNATFYAVPAPRTVARWSEQVPAGFRFVFKVPRTITHERRLRGADEELATFLQAIEPLHDHLGPIMVQLPPSLAPDDFDTLARFVRRLPIEFPWAVEVRHREFFAGGSHERNLDEMLRVHGVNRVIMDARSVHAGPSQTDADRDEQRSKPDLPVRPVATATSPVVRFIGQRNVADNAPYWQPWVRVCARWLTQGLRPLVLCHTPDNVDSPALAQQFADAVARAVPELARLSGNPWRPPPEPNSPDSTR